MKKIFEGFHKLSGLEINEKKTKVIRIGTNLDDNKPLGVDIDNKLELLAEN